VSDSYGLPNPKAPRELTQFDFLVGAWDCASTIRAPDGTVQTRPATWAGRYILDGYVIADEFRQLGPSGEVALLGQTYRSFNGESKTWVMKWFDALDSTWLDLGTEDIGGVQVRAGTITFQHRRPRGRAGRLFPLNSLFRITFSDMSDVQFRWRAELSTDGGETWAEVQTIEARREPGLDRRPA
jgi:hypothetical protein